MNQIADYRSRFGLNTTPFTREIRVQDRFVIEDNEKVLQRLLVLINYKGLGLKFSRLNRPLAGSRLRP